MTADAAPESNNCITKEEFDVYDRQIRLWGLEAQNALRSSSVLLVGLSPLGAEVTKNLMLCGLGSLTISDSKSVEEDDLVSSFLLEEEDARSNRAVASAAKARSLNPMVEFKALKFGIRDFDKEELKKFDLIILVDEAYDVVNEMDVFCRQNRIKFMAGSVYGWFGYAFVDFNQHSFLMKQAKKHAVAELDAEDDKTATAHTTIEDDAFEKRQLEYPSFESAFNVDWTAKKNQRKAKRVVPPSYVYIRAILRAEQEKIALGNMTEMSRLFNEERKNIGQTDAIPECSERDVMFMAGPQLSAVAAIVGGTMGQEAIKALSEGECPLHNIFVYSAPHTTGHMLHYPPNNIDFLFYI